MARGNGDALPLATGHFADRPLGIVCRQTDAIEKGGDFLSALGFRHDVVDAQWIVQHRGNGGARVEGAEHVLKHHLHPGATMAEIRAGQRKPVLAFEPDRTGVGRQQPHQDAGEGGFPAA
jgi:hypothetical protein